MSRMLSMVMGGCGLAVLACGPAVNETSGAQSGETGSVVATSSSESSGSSSDTSSGGSSSSSGEPEICPEADPEAVFTARIEPCLDEACDETDPEFWFPSMSERESAETTQELRCTVSSSDPSSVGGHRWLLTDCEGAGAPPSGTIVFELDAPSLPPLVVGDEVLVQVHRQYGAWVYQETHAWAVRSGDGTMLAVFSQNGDLPTDEVTAPFDLVARPYCLEQVVAGREGPMELEVSRDTDSVRIPAGNLATLGESLIILERSQYATDMPGAYGGWTLLKFLIVASI